MALMLCCYRNFFIVLEDNNLPYIIRSSKRRLFLMILTPILTYGSIIGIWYFYGVWASLIALIMRMIIGRISYKHYFNREVTELATWHYQQMVSIKSNPNLTFKQQMEIDTFDRLYRELLLQEEDITQWDEPYMLQAAYNRAQKEMHHRMTRSS